ncbi:delta-aminolevulinic acid dehydratase [Haliea sp. E17]|uniref:delta-aminolevulinic acid dehydratase n=1 Tax=Haliea sp. E17 TaxID=3401576 RepID=UPI003AABBCF2
MLRCLPLLLFTVSLCQPAWAECECLWRGSFAEVEAEADLVISATALSSKGNSVDFTVDRTLRGALSPAEVRVWMQARDYCRPPAEDFPPGSSWVLALQHIDAAVPGGFDPATPNISYGRVGDYLLSSCGGYWLKREQDYVTGPLVDSPRWERAPKMTPVLLDIVAAFVAGEVDVQTLKDASQENPALRELRLNTRAFLRASGAPAPDPQAGD